MGFAVAGGAYVIAPEMVNKAFLQGATISDYLPAAVYFGIGALGPPTGAYIGRRIGPACEKFFKKTKPETNP